VENNMIGSDPRGAIGLGNLQNGIFIDNAPENRNIRANHILGNGANGILIQGAGANGNDVGGNFIGVQGTQAIPNKLDGIRIDSASSNVIGSIFDSTPGNVISGNDGDGIHITGIGAT